MPELKRIGIVGCGSIGGQLARSISSYFKDRTRLMVICDQDNQKAMALSNELNPHPDVLPLDSIPLHCDLVIEAASPETCRELVPKALNMGRDIMVLSASGLVDIYDKAFNLAKAKQARLYVPSGPITGIDGLEAAMTGGVRSVRLTMRKPSAVLGDAPHVQSKKLQLSSLTAETVIFEGSAREAIKGFPHHIHAAATLSFAGLGLDQTQVRILTGPEIAMHIYDVEIEGAFGRLAVRSENVPSPQNPNHSYLSLLSACALLNEILSPVQLGT